MTDYSRTHRRVVANPEGFDYHCTVCGRSGNQLRTKPCRKARHMRNPYKAIRWIMVLAALAMAIIIYGRYF